MGAPEAPTLKGYRLEERLDPGPPEVWRASFVAGSKRVRCLVHLLHEHAVEPRFWAEWLPQVKLVARVLHSNVIAILDCGEEDGARFFVNEHVPSRNLDEVLARTRTVGEVVPPAIAARIVADACAGLHSTMELQDGHGWHLNFGHRQLGLETLLVGLDGTTRITGLTPPPPIDLGPAILPPRRGREYLSPEELRGQRPGPRSNVFSLGAILHRLLSDSPPFERATDLASLQAVLEEDPTPLPEGRTPEILARHLSVAVAKVPEHRWQYPRVLGLALEAYLDKAGGGSSADVAAFLRRLFPEEAVEAAQPRAQGPRPRRPEGLPSALVRWQRELSIFPPEVALTLGPWLQRLEVAFGVARHLPQAGAGEPDGLGALSRRGAYERLLLSEWLLADELPDEFLRRAAMQEHLFLEVARKRPHGARRVAVLLDASPSQQGSPRLAHLACLVVLAARARAAGDVLLVGVLGDEQCRPWDEVSPMSVRAILQGRRPLEAQPGDLARWRERLALEKTDDLWLVGAPRLGRLAGQVSRVEVCDVIEPGARQLRLDVRALGTTPRGLTLELPEAGACTRLLRDPFDTAEAAGQPRTPELAAGSPLFFSWHGRRLIARSPDGGVVALSVPNSPRAMPGRARLFQPLANERLLAAGFVGRHFIALTCRYGQILLWGRGKPQLELAPYDRLCTCLGTCEALVSLPLDAPLGSLLEGTAPRSMCALAGGVLVQLDLGPPPEVKVVSQLAVSAVVMGGTLTYVERDPYTKSRAYLRGRDGFARGLLGTAGFDAFAGRTNKEGHLAVHQFASEWLVLYGNVASTSVREFQLSGAPGTVVGLVRRREGQAPSLLTLPPGGHALVAVGRDGSFALPPASSPIVSACASPDGALAAWLTERGDVEVFSFRHDRVLARYFGTRGEEPAGTTAAAGARGHA
ncbi:MAG: protein kinase domain-containing protein [Myxococcaceae bacterium]